MAIDQRRGDAGTEFSAWFAQLDPSVPLFERADAARLQVERLTSGLDVTAERAVRAHLFTILAELLDAS
ncbi:MAG TPA: hypothetical protein VF230_09075 [Acidimicrobiales bacterium]